MVQNGIGKMQSMVSSTVYTYEMSNVGYVNIILSGILLKWLVIHFLHQCLLLKWLELSQYVGSSHSMLVVAVQQSDGLEIKAVFQSLIPCLDAPVLTPPSG
jgi:hypothetical protein